MKKNNATQELNLTKRVSPDLSVLLAVMDKQIILDSFKERDSTGFLKQEC